jgi:hypothetical protein
MIQVFTIILLLAAAVGAYLGANACATGSGSQQGLLVLAGALMSATLPSVPALLAPKSSVPNPRNSQVGHASPSIFMLLAFVGYVAFVGAVMTPHLGCHNVKPDALWGATVDCAKVNPANDAARSAIMSCVAGLVMANTSACITGLVVGMKYDDPAIEAKVKIRWAIDEVACVTAWVAEQENAKVGTPLEELRTQPIRNAANKFLTDRHISIRNTYPGG